MAEPADDATDPTETAPAQPGKGTVAVRVSTLIGGAVIAVLAIIALVLGVLLGSARSDLSDLKAQDADNAKAEQIALDYAVGSATLNYQDVNAWVAKLKAGTSPELSAKFDATGAKLEQIIIPLKWTSAATPITAKVMSHEGEVYKVAAFVDVSTTNAQNPDGLRNTVTYNITVDAGKDWKITDVGSTDGALPTK
ncbi:hypothetical protein [Nocardia rhizosphaerihabitans]|uniref:Mce-associated membrane protein n=1 Tax=Nocardia rhizosphaerihabitans TaxID=1691570 RepID=A0ABQ2KIX8_9NOCA|nr:hypothetical protein [Nocardia rhizosphaerihabitans]GGN84698.1 hypothetical protein GCM10011610_38270 [Nocardia rhizosphaerihabitans]